jgi:hypothetical protein
MERNVAALAMVTFLLEFVVTHFGASILWSSIEQPFTNGSKWQYDI